MPASLMFNAIPVVDQLDTLVLLLRGLRPGLMRCPAEESARHCAPLKLAPTQVETGLISDWSD